MLDTTALKNELQARINALTNASTFDQVVDIAIAERKAAQAGIALARSNLATQLQRITNAVGAGSAIEDLIVLAAGARGDADSLPIGHVGKFAFSGDKFTDNNFHEWLLMGLLHSKAGYDRALENPGLRSFGQQIYTANAATAGTPIKGATDGLGNFVIACGNSTNVMVIKNNGESVLAVPHNLPGNAVTVEHVAGHFIVAGNSASNIFTSYSSDGGDSFSASSNARGIAGGIADTVRSSASNAGALFVCQGSPGAVYKTSGTSNAAANLPASIASYVPLVQFFEGAFYVAQRNSWNYYKTLNNGEAFTTHAKPAGVNVVANEYFFTALGRFIWVGQSGASWFFKYTTDFETWHDTFELMPVALREYINHHGNSGLQIFAHPVQGGVVVSTAIGSYFTANFESWKVVSFSRSAEELAGTGASLGFFGNFVFGAVNPYTGSISTPGAPSTSILKVDYSTPDYVGIHKRGVPQIDEYGTIDYVRIK